MVSAHPVIRWNRHYAVLVLCLGLGSVYLRTPLPLAIVALCVSSGAWLLGPGRLNAPNAITWARLALVAVALIFAPHQPHLIFACALAAWLLDGVDGWLARRLGQESAFGALFDQETDALLVMMLCVQLVITRDFGPWLLLAGALRYVFVLVRELAKGPLPERRSTWGRAIFSFSYLSLVCGLLPELSIASAVAVPVGLALLLYSFAPDFVAVARAS